MFQLDLGLPHAAVALRTIAVISAMTVSIRVFRKSDLLGL